jgi:hypothetical protein
MGWQIFLSFRILDWKEASYDGADEFWGKAILITHGPHFSPSQGLGLNRAAQKSCTGV